MFSFKRFIILNNIVLCFLCIGLFIYQTKSGHVIGRRYCLVNFFLLLISSGHAYRHFYYFKQLKITIKQYIKVNTPLFFIGLVLIAVIFPEREHELNIVISLLIAVNTLFFGLIFVVHCGRWNLTFEKFHFNNTNLDSHSNTNIIFDRPYRYSELSSAQNIGFEHHESFTCHASIFDHSLYHSNGFSQTDSLSWGGSDMGYSSINPASGLPMVDSCFDSHGNIYGTYDSHY
ncbi:hypothetical protein [Providencia sp. PROV197]|uniref:hypothetical protein n=1 Tax=Providencia sp. PROV197 TaxID=2949898 RepID=UPI00234BBDB0|nr:hypothetical protein [Providencia sp. PROV197]